MSGPLLVRRRPPATSRGIFGDPAPARIHPQLSEQPLTIPGLRLWLAADAIRGVGHSATFQNWHDLSLHRENVNQSTAGQRPRFWTQTVNHLPVVSLDGVDDTMTAVPSVAFPVDNWTMWGVVRNRNLGTRRQVVLFIGHGSTNGYGFAVRANAGMKGGLFGGVAWLDGSEAEGQNFDIYVFQRRAGTTRLWVNGAAPKLTTATVPVAPSNLITIGQAPGNELSDVDVAELGFHDGSASLADANRLGEYLAERYRLTWATATN